jgi:hypothetical protein
MEAILMLFIEAAKASLTREVVLPAVLRDRWVYKIKRGEFSIIPLYKFNPLCQNYFWQKIK